MNWKHTHEKALQIGSEFKKAIAEKSMSVSNAKKIAAVITPETQEEWIGKAQTLTAKQLDQEIVKAHPQKALPERALQRKPQLVSKPVYRNGKRTPVPAAMRHAVIRQAQGQCAYRAADGKRCSNRRYLELHHCRPVSIGGKHDEANLTYLCHEHHSWRHFRTASENIPLPSFRGQLGCPSYRVIAAARS